MSKWISVNTRLPEDKDRNHVECLVYDKYWGIVVRPYNQHHVCWDQEDADDYYCHPTNGKITHWQPLPEPPKD